MNYSQQIPDNHSKMTTEIFVIFLLTIGGVFSKTPKNEELLESDQVESDQRFLFGTGQSTSITFGLPTFLITAIYVFIPTVIGLAVLFYLYGGPKYRNGNVYDYDTGYQYTGYTSRNAHTSDVIDRSQYVVL